MTTNSFPVCADVPHDVACAIDALIDVLSDLRISRWPAAPASAAEYALARAFVDVALADGRRDVAAWYVRDCVDTAVFLACRAEGATRRETCERARVTAEGAALALLARPAIDARDFERLYAPCAALLSASAGSPAAPVTAGPRRAVRA